MIWYTRLKEKICHKTWFRRKSWTQINQCTLSKNLHQPIEFWLAMRSHCHFYMYLCLIYLFTSYSHIKYMRKQLIYIQKCKLYSWNQWILLYSNKIVNLCWWNIIISIASVTLQIVFKLILPTDNPVTQDLINGRDYIMNLIYEKWINTT